MSVERNVYQTSQGGKVFVLLEDKARIIRCATPRFARMLSSLIVFYPCGQGAPITTTYSSKPQASIEQPEHCHHGLRYIPSPHILCSASETYVAA